MKRFFGQRAAAWSVLIGYVLLLLILTHIPHPPGVLERQNDKTLHFLAYLSLGAAAYTAAAISFPRRVGLSLIVFLACVVFAAIDEITQPAFGRSADVLDLRADIFGLLTAILVMTTVRLLLSRLRLQGNRA